jgi:hypothetical protein
MTADEIPASGEVPVACSLDADALGTRAEEWRALVASSVESVDAAAVGAAGARAVRLVLRPSEEALVAAAALGQREKQCCAFFDIAIELGPEQRALVVSVPEGAEEALATFVALLRS